MEATLSSSSSRSHQGAALAHLDSLPLHDPPFPKRKERDGFISFVLGKGGSGVLANYLLRNTKTILSLSAGPVCSSFSAKPCAILQALRWSQQHQHVGHFSSLVPPGLLFRPLLSLTFYLKLCGRNRLLFYYQTIIGPWPLISPEKRRD